ncbi:pilus assembly PilX family protein [Aeromonas veronii]|uniref:pilus assembly PilX family protein n=1 Tax=Aeromonas veronii TaxID=654 RepID=UPI002444E3BE|nr:PilX N-terminal domain-containing pilus assembly protein [Aeromonas veronii]
MMDRQQGMALVISLIFLVMVSLLGMASMRGAQLQEKMAGNQKEALQALQAAEAGLRAAERYIEAGNSGPYDNSAGLYEFIDTAVDPASPFDRLAYLYQQWSGGARSRILYRTVALYPGGERGSGSR